MEWKRDRRIGDLQKVPMGTQVRLNGWVQRRRDHGGLIFVDLRDVTGTVQVVFDQAEAEDLFALAESLRTEYVIAVSGQVVARSAELINPKLTLGHMEIKASGLALLNRAKTPPFLLSDNNVDESVRLHYRYLDLRRDNMQANLRLRHKALLAIRQFMDDQGFFEVETPLLTRSTPEGARDYLVPARLQQGALLRGREPRALGLADAARAPRPRARFRPLGL